jgi:hypothetical protein
MADKILSSLTAKSAALAVGDLLPYVDVSDTTEASSGTTKHIHPNELAADPLMLIKSQVTPTAKTVAVTLTIAELLTGIITGTHAEGATQAYQLPTGTLCEGGATFAVDSCFDWSLINLSAAAIDTITLTAGADHTIVGNPIVQSAHSTTGGIYGNSAIFRTRKTALNTFVTYRIA